MAAETLPPAMATIQSEEQVADVAQLVEQLIRNQQVVSSSLTVGSIAITKAKELKLLLASRIGEVVLE
jgi:hypothetical protein